MIVDTPTKKAISSIRLAMSQMLYANEGLLAQRLIEKLERPVCNVGSRHLYPSWCKRDDQYLVMTPDIPAKLFFRSAVRHVWNACLAFEAAGMSQAALVCLEFGGAIVKEELLMSPDITTGPLENHETRSSQRQ